MTDSPSIVSVETADGKFQQKIGVGRHKFLADEPVSFGRDGQRPVAL